MCCYNVWFERIVFILTLQIQSTLDFFLLKETYFNNDMNKFNIIKRRVYFIITFIIVFISSPFISAQNNVLDQSYLNKELIKYCEQGDLQAVTYLVNQGANTNCQDNQNVTPLMYACQNGFFDIVKILIDNNAITDLKSKNGLLALHIAVRAKRYNIITLLINKGASVNTPDNFGATPLLYAVALSDKGSIQILLDFEADVNIPDHRGNTPFLVAAEKNNDEIINMLSIYGANQSKANNVGLTPLMSLVKNGNLNLFWQYSSKEELIKSDFNGNTILTYAIIGGSNQIIDTLLKIDNSLFQNQNQKISDLTYSKIHNNPIARKKINQYKSEISYKPFLSEIFAGVGTTFSSKDLYINTFVGVKEERFQLSAIAGFSFRPAWQNVLIQQQGNIYNQYNQKRQAVFVNINKDFTLFNRRFLAPFKLTVGGSLYYSFATNKGVSQKPDSKINFSPQIGLHYRNNTFGTAFHYQNINYNDGLSANKYSFSIYLPLIRSKKIIGKTKYAWNKLTR